MFFWLSVIVALVARRPRPVIAEPWLEPEDGVQPVDPRPLSYLDQMIEDQMLYRAQTPLMQRLRGAANYDHWQAEYARHQAAIKV